MRSCIRTVMGILIAIIMTSGVYVHARNMDPKEALQSVEAHPFQSDVLISSVESLQEAMKQTPEDPWVYLGLARAYLIDGYRSGSRFEADSFSSDSVDNAGRLVEHALKLDPELARGYAMRARLQILEGEYRKAWDTLNRAYELDRDDFNPWYLMGVLNRYYGEYEQSAKMLRKAASAAEHPYQMRWVFDQRIDLAEATDDPAAEEKVHREVIATFPDRAHGYGNYGAFLLEQDRYDEAIERFETALDIQRYPLAEKQLAKARRLAAESH